MAIIKGLSVATAISFALNLLTTNAAQAFTFTKIANISGDFIGSVGSPAINDAGTVAFFANLNGGGKSLLSASGGATTLIADTSSDFSDFFDLAINDEGTVAFSASLDGGDIGIFTNNGGIQSTIATLSNSPSIVGFSADFFTGLDINDGGTVAFLAGNNDTQEEGIFTVNGGVTTIAKTSSGGFNDLFELSLNNQGTIAFFAFSDTEGEGIFIGNGVTPTTRILDANNTPFGVFGTIENPIINDAGTVVFQTSFEKMGQATVGIFTLSSGNNNKLTLIADTSSPFDFSLGNPAINNQGTVAFSAPLDNGGFGIFTGADPVADKVIATGDALFGSTVTALNFSNQGLNNSGQIAFYAELANGTKGIFRAEPDVSMPKPVPEPTSLFGLLAVGVLGAGSTVRKAQTTTKNLVTTVRTYQE